MPNAINHLWVRLQTIPGHGRFMAARVAQCFPHEFHFRTIGVFVDEFGRTFFGYDLDHTWRNDEDLGDNKRTFERMGVRDDGEIFKEL